MHSVLLVTSICVGVGCEKWGLVQGQHGTEICSQVDHYVTVSLAGWFYRSTANHFKITIKFSIFKVG